MKLKYRIIYEVLAETRIRKVYESYRAIDVMLDNMEKLENKRELIRAGDRIWNCLTSKYVSANYDRLVKLAREAAKRLSSKSI